MDPLGEDVVLVGLVEARAWPITLVADKKSKHVVSGPVLRHSILAAIQQLREYDVAEAVRPLGDQLQGVFGLVLSEEGAFGAEANVRTLSTKKNWGRCRRRYWQQATAVVPFSCTGGHATLITVTVQLGINV